MKRRGFTKVELLVVLAIIILFSAILFPVLRRYAQLNRGRASCQSNLKHIALSVKQYQSDWDSQYPQVRVKDININEKNPFGWADALDHYLKWKRAFWCPTQVRNGSHDVPVMKPSDRDYTDYFYNRRLAGIEAKKIKQVSLTILLGEGNDETDAANARYSLSTLPAAWRNDKTSPSYRHVDGANYAFADGHVKWMQPDKITDKKPDGKTYTFAVQ